MNEPEPISFEAVAAFADSRIARRKPIWCPLIMATFGCSSDQAKALVARYLDRLAIRLQLTQEADLDPRAAELHHPNLLRRGRAFISKLMDMNRNLRSHTKVLNARIQSESSRAANAESDRESTIKLGRNIQANYERTLADIRKDNHNLRGLLQEERIRLDQTDFLKEQVEALSSEIDSQRRRIAALEKQLLNERQRNRVRESAMRSAWEFAESRFVGRTAQ